MESVLMGGTHQYGDFNESLDPKDKKFVYDGCLEMARPLKQAKILWEKVGLRPGRSSIRVEEETFANGKNGIIVRNFNKICCCCCT